MSPLPDANPSPRGPQGRERELQLLTETLDALHRGAPLSLTLVNLVGIPGIGKSRTLDDLYVAASGDKHRRTLVLRLNFQGEVPLPDDHPAAQMLVLRSLLEQSRSQGLVLPAVQQLADMLDGDAAGRDWAVALRQLAQLLRAPGQHGVLLLIDGCERAPRALLDWLEANLLRSLVVSERALCILASRDPLTFGVLELRLRVQMLRLDPLPEWATVEQVRQLGLTRASEGALYRLTGGIPLAIVIAAEELAAARDDQTLQDDMLRRTILTRVIQAILDRLPDTLTEEPRQALNVIALLREYDAEMLHFILPQTSVTFARYNLDSAYWLVTQLNASGLVRWQDAARALCLDRGLRPLFAEAVRLTDPRLFKQVNQAAADYYERLLREAPRGRNQFLIEYYYHTLYNPESPRYNEIAFRAEFEKRLLTSYYSPSRTFADNVLLSRLEELLQADDELQQALERHKLSPRLMLDTVRSVRSKYPVQAE